MYVADLSTAKPAAPAGSISHDDVEDMMSSAAVEGQAAGNRHNQSVLVEQTKSTQEAMVRVTAVGAAVASQVRVEVQHKKQVRCISDAPFAASYAC